MTGPLPRSWRSRPYLISTEGAKSKIAGIFAVAGLAVTGVAPAATTSPAPASTVVCTVDDPRAIELSGLVATADGYVSVVDSQWDESQVVIVYLDQACRVTRTVSYPTPARDPEDLAVAPDGALWVADIGDNNSERKTVALWRIPPEGGAPVIYRLTYPDGAHDAEAMLFAGDGTPVIVTKELAAVSGVYQAERALEPNTAEGVPMRRVGDFRPTLTGDPADLTRIAQVLVTGAATSPDRTRVALRTYTAAYEWDVPDGDVAAAITTRTPRITPLSDDPQGEGLSYTVDGQAFLTCSDQSGSSQLRRYARAADPTPTIEAGSASASESSALLWYGFALGAGGGAVLLGLLAWLVTSRLRRR